MSETIGRKILQPKSKVRRRIKRWPALPRKPRNLKITAEQLLERQLKVYGMRVDEGKTWEQIGNAVGIAPSTARKDALVVRRARWEGLVERDEDIKDESNERYDQLLARWIPLALNPNIVVQGVVKGKVIQLPEWQSAREAAEIMLKILRQREQLNGLLDPKARATPQEIGEGVAEGVMKALQEFAIKSKSEKVVQATVVKSEITNDETPG